MHGQRWHAIEESNYATRCLLAVSGRQVGTAGRDRCGRRCGKGSRTLLESVPGIGGYDRAGSEATHSKTGRLIGRRCARRSKYAWSLSLSVLA